MTLRRNMKKYFVYILMCRDGSYYTGVTNDLSRRLKEHNEGKCKYTNSSQRKPVELVFKAEFSDIWLAIQKEKQIKKWTRKKKEALIEGELNKLTFFSKKNF